MSRVEVEISWSTAARPLTDPAVRKLVLQTLRHARCRFERLGIVFVNDAELTRLHARWLADRSPTDVISFDLSEGRRRMGELYVSVACARRVARQRGVSPARELALYVAHGVLHLCGHDDHRPRERAAMRAAERAILAKLGYEDDPLPHP